MQCQKQSRSSPDLHPKPFPLWITLVVLVVVMPFLVLLVYSTYRWLRQQQPKQVMPVTPVLPVDQVSTVGHTGDLLLFASGWCGPPALRQFFHGSPWSHVGILWIDPVTRIPYVWESIRARRHYPLRDQLTGRVGREGPQLTNLRDKLSTYDKGGFCHLLCLSPSLEEVFDFSEERLYSQFELVFDRYKHYRFADPLPMVLPLFLSCLDIPMSYATLPHRDGKMNCVQLAHATLQTLNVCKPGQLHTAPKHFQSLTNSVGSRQIVQEYRLPVQ